MASDSRKIWTINLEVIRVKLRTFTFLDYLTPENQKYVRAGSRYLFILPSTFSLVILNSRCSRSHEKFCDGSDSLKIHCRFLRWTACTVHLCPQFTLCPAPLFPILCKLLCLLHCSAKPTSAQRSMCRSSKTLCKSCWKHRCHNNSYH